MPHGYSEDNLIQKSTAQLMEKELGWKSIMAWDAEKLGADGTLYRRRADIVGYVNELPLLFKATYRMEFY